MPNANKQQIRAKKIADLIALVNGDLAPRELRGQKHLISIDWGEEPDGNDDWNVFIIDGKRVDRQTFNNELAWRAENKK